MVVFGIKALEITIIAKQNRYNVYIVCTYIAHLQLRIVLILLLKLLAMSPPEAGNISDTQPWDGIEITGKYLYIPM